MQFMTATVLSWYRSRGKLADKIRTGDFPVSAWTCPFKGISRHSNPCTLILRHLRPLVNDLVTSSNWCFCRETLSLGLSCYVQQASFDSLTTFWDYKVAMGIPVYLLVQESLCCCKSMSEFMNIYDWLIVYDIVYGLHVQAPTNYLNIRGWNLQIDILIKPSPNFTCLFLRWLTCLRWLPVGRFGHFRLKVDLCVCVSVQVWATNMSLDEYPPWN